MTQAAAAVAAMAAGLLGANREGCAAVAGETIRAEAVARREEERPFYNL